MVLLNRFNGTFASARSAIHDLLFASVKVTRGGGLKVVVELNELYITGPQLLDVIFGVRRIIARENW